MGKEKKGDVVRRCISSRRGPWLVHRTRKDGSVVTRERYPSETERLKNMQRERNRRAVTRKIFDGVRAHGNYSLPKHVDTNELLKALCNEAGWHVEEDGTICRKNQNLTNPQHEDKCDKDAVSRVENKLLSTNVCLAMLQEDQNIDVTLSLSLSPA